MTLQTPSNDTRVRGRWSLGWKLVSLLLSLLVLAVGATPAAGQLWEPYVTVAPQAGVSIPTGGLADMVDPGPTAGIRVSSWFTPRFAFMGDVTLEMLPGASLSSGAKAPDLKVWHVTAGAETNLLPPTMPLSLVASLGAGLSAYNSDPYRPTPQTASPWRLRTRDS